jgi:hypothetical protein
MATSLAKLRGLADFMRSPNEIAPRQLAESDNIQTYNVQEVSG